MVVEEPIPPQPQYLQVRQPPVERSMARDDRQPSPLAYNNTVNSDTKSRRGTMISQGRSRGKSIVLPPSESRRHSTLSR